MCDLFGLTPNDPDGGERPQVKGDIDVSNQRCCLFMRARVLASAVDETKSLSPFHNCKSIFVFFCYRLCLFTKIIFGVVSVGQKPKYHKNVVKIKQYISLTHGICRRCPTVVLFPQDTNALKHFRCTADRQKPQRKFREVNYIGPEP